MSEEKQVNPVETVLEPTEQSPEEQNASVPADAEEQATSLSELEKANQKIAELENELIKQRFKIKEESFEKVITLAKSLSTIKPI